jgi:divalent metal cation (Fe/Co/Zn/Cd) transporter
MEHHHTESRDSRLLRHGLQLEYVTLLWNVAGVGVTAMAALKAHSIALGGFGLDSLLEIGASAIVVKELTRRDQHAHGNALRLLAAGFIGISIYILIQALYLLGHGIHPKGSPLGIAWAAATLLVMLGLAYGKHVTGRKLNNPVLLTEGRVTLVDAYLAAAITIGLLLNATLHWWWADPAASLVIVYYGIKEGVSALRESHVG